MGLMDMLSQITHLNDQNAEQHFDQVAGHASADDLAPGLADAMRSPSTQPFGQMVGQMFGQSSPDQRAGMLNQILATLGPAAATALAGGVLGRVLRPGQTQVTPEDASKITPAEATEIATHAEQAQPGVVDQVSSFYAQHSTLVKTLGGAALAIALARMQQSLTSRR